MQLQNIKIFVVAAYVVAIGVAAVVSGVTSISGRLALAALAILPAFALVRLWNHPSETMSQSIQAARR